MCRLGLLLILVMLIESSCAAKKPCTTKPDCESDGGECQSYHSYDCHGTWKKGRKYCKTWKRCGCCVPSPDPETTPIHTTCPSFTCPTVTCPTVAWPTKDRCIDPFIKFEGQCIKLFTKDGTFAEHRQECWRIGGSDLLEVKEETFPSLRRYLENVPGYRIWIGGQYNNKEGTFKWPSGRIVSTSSWWAEGEPNNLRGDEYCMILQDTAGQGGTFLDVTCTYDFEYSLCEKLP